jgi:hypothetical protein
MVIPLISSVKEVTFGCHRAKSAVDVDVTRDLCRHNSPLLKTPAICLGGSSVFLKFKLLELYTVSKMAINGLGQSSPGT